MVGVLRNPTYARLFIAQVVALLGTGLLTVALGLLAFDLAGRDAGAVMGTALTIKMVAYVGVAPVVAALVDRLPKKAVLVGADLIRFAVALLLPFVAEVWQIYALVFVLQSASATFTPAFQSLIPAVLPDERQYTRALSLSRLAYDLESLLSPAFAAALLAVVSYHDLFVGTAIGFAGSIAFVLLARLPAAAVTTSGLPFWRRLREGAEVFSRTKTLWFLMSANVAVAAGTALVMVNTVVYVRGVMDRDDAALGLTLACYGLGSLLVALATPWIVERVGVIRTMMAGVAVIAIALGSCGSGHCGGHDLGCRLGMALGYVGATRRGHVPGQHAVLAAACRCLHRPEPQSGLYGPVCPLSCLLSRHLSDRGLVGREQLYLGRRRLGRRRDPRHGHCVWPGQCDRKRAFVS